MWWSRRPLSVRRSMVIRCSTMPRPTKLPLVPMPLPCFRRCPVLRWPKMDWRRRAAPLTVSM
ncbi:MAG: hypothetical protein IKD17_03580 [Alistipes sp.]|nr:hypothetical protein [Alistipes sp.]